MIAIVDYGAGNLRSVSKAFDALGYPSIVTSEPRDLERADLILLPGVGAAADAMRQLQRHGLVQPLRAYIREGRPFLGVCLGLQLLYSFSEEGEGAHCLDVVPGVVRRFPSGLKVPHMGWNQVRSVRPHPLFQGLSEGSHFYFVHSYYGVPEDSAVIAAETDYGVTFASVLIRDNLIGVQFHPEKSSDLGLRLYANALHYFGFAEATAPTA